jgi:hypothetical protein
MTVTVGAATEKAGWATAEMKAIGFTTPADHDTEQSPQEQSCG